ncbi:MAG TPA: hypothetical protein VGQ60_03340 [Nitrospiraceae bacterium]|jgi:hypothetical protein|nr:hypothetical protein [Nitrospiraceae bacterium]
MASVPTPELPSYRITLFYGPESVQGRAGIQNCVFNVKKRSWKAGIQVAVEVAGDHLDRVRARLGFESWLEKLVAGLEAADRPSYMRRADELLVQGVCALKLDLAIEAGIAQENQRLDSQAFIEQLDERLPQEGHRIKSHIMAELDLASP